MATIRTLSDGHFTATFNRRQLDIRRSGKRFKAVDTATGEILDGGELKSVKALVEWHVESKRVVSELVTVATTRSNRT